jgi:hypothetical protein
MKNLIVVILLSIGISSTSFAQSRSFTATEAPRKNFTTIIFAGLGGAILGLSTLSFRGRPQDHMDDIAVGFAVGIIAGALYTSYIAATEPEKFYGFEPNAFDRYVKRDSIVSRSQGDFKTEIVSFQYSF